MPDLCVVCQWMDASQRILGVSEGKAGRGDHGILKQGGTSHCPNKTQTWKSRSCRISRRRRKDAKSRYFDVAEKGVQAC